jgi:hypothetical protein
MTIAIALKTTLYERDLNLWVEDTIAKLKAGDLQNLDIENLIEELEGLAGRDRRELKSRLRTLLEHILKRKYVNMPECFGGWVNTIYTQRNDIEDIIEQSPSLKSLWEETFDSAWRSALKKVRSEYKSAKFPDTWQFNRDIESMLNIDFWE